MVPPLAHEDSASGGACKNILSRGDKRRGAAVLVSIIVASDGSMPEDSREDRRDFLKCMAWAGTGALFAFAGGIGSSIGLDSALAAPVRRTSTAPFTFVQLSDSHIGFNKPPNTDARGTFREAIAKVRALPNPPDF